jgi:hypothetical protein
MKQTTFLYITTIVLYDKHHKGRSMHAPWGPCLVNARRIALVPDVCLVGDRYVAGVDGHHKKLKTNETDHGIERRL